MPVYVFSNNDQGAEWNVPQYYWPSIIKNNPTDSSIKNLKKQLMVELLQSIIKYTSNNPSIRINPSICAKLKVLCQMVWDSRLTTYMRLNNSRTHRALWAQILKQYGKKSELAACLQKMTSRNRFNLYLVLQKLFRCIGDKDHDGRPDVMFSALNQAFLSGIGNLPITLLRTAILSSKSNMVRYFQDFGNGEGDGTTLGNIEALRIVALRGNPMNNYTQIISHGRYTLIRKNTANQTREQQLAMEWIRKNEKNEKANAQYLLAAMQKERVTPLSILRNAVNRARVILQILEAAGLSLEGKRVAPSDFSQRGLDGEEAWKALLKNGYIDEKGQLLPKFNGIYKDFNIGSFFNEEEKRKIFIFLRSLPSDLTNGIKIDRLIMFFQKIANQTLTNEHLLATYTNLPEALKKLGESNSGKMMLNILNLASTILPHSSFTQPALDICLKNSIMVRAIKSFLLELCEILRDVQKKGPLALQPIFFSKFVGEAWSFFDRWAFDWRKDAYNLGKVARVIQQIESIEDRVTFINYYLRFFYAHPGKPQVSYSFPLQEFHKLSRAAKGVVKEGMPRITCATYAIIAKYLLEAAGYRGIFVGLYHTNLLKKRSPVLGHCILFAERRTNSIQKIAAFLKRLGWAEQKIEQFLAKNKKGQWVKWQPQIDEERMKKELGPHWQKIAKLWKHSQEDDPVIFVNNERVYTVYPFEVHLQNIKAEAISFYQISLGPNENIIISPLVITADKTHEIEDKINEHFDKIVVVLLSHQYYSSVSEALELAAYLQQRESAYLVSPEGKRKTDELRKTINYLTLLSKHLTERGQRLIRKNGAFVRITIPLQKGHRQIKFKVNNPRSMELALQRFGKQCKHLVGSWEKIEKRRDTYLRLTYAGMLGLAKAKEK